MCLLWCPLYAIQLFWNYASAVARFHVFSIHPFSQCLDIERDSTPAIYRLQEKKGRERESALQTVGFFQSKCTSYSGWIGLPQLGISCYGALLNILAFNVMHRRSVGSDKNRYGFGFSERSSEHRHNEMGAFCYQKLKSFILQNAVLKVI